MVEPILLEVVSAERLVLREHVSRLTAPGSRGYLGVLPSHAPLITSLEPGVVTYTHEGQTKKLAVSGGFLEVYADKVTILADTAELQQEIDVERALRAKERAEMLLRKRVRGLNAARAELALKRALARIKSVK